VTVDDFPEDSIDRPRFKGDTRLIHPKGAGHIPTISSFASLYRNDAIFRGLSATFPRGALANLNRAMTNLGTHHP
jgi:hypothetical protein